MKLKKRVFNLERHFDVNLSCLGHSLCNYCENYIEFNICVEGGRRFFYSPSFCDLSACLSPPKPIWTPLDSSDSLQPSPPKLYMTGVDWSRVESTGQSSPVGVHMDFYHYKILLEWTPLDSTGFGDIITAY